MAIREASLNDVPAIAKVHVDAWRTTYQDIVPQDYLDQLSYQKREHTWNQWLNNTKESGQFTYVAQDTTKQIVGFASGGLERTQKYVYKGEIYAIYVLKSHQKIGIGRQLFTAIIDRLAQAEIYSMLLWVLEKNHSARKFYQSLGGEKVYEQMIEIGGAQLQEFAYGWRW